MKVDRSDVRAYPEETVQDYEARIFGSANVNDGAETTNAPRLGRRDLNDTSVVTNSQPLNPFLASVQPSLDPDSGVFNKALFFESLAEYRRQESNRHPPKAFGVAFENISVYGSKSSTDYQRTFGNYPAALFSKAFGHGKERVNILNGIDGLVHQGEMLLVLGRPGSGCSTLLKTIAGELRGLDIGGKSEISYNGKFNNM